MSYKTILVHVDASRRASERIRIAAQIALAENAHLIGTAMTGLSRFVFEGSGFDLNVAPWSVHLNGMRERANSALEAFERQARAMGVPSLESRLVDDEAAAGISVQARYCDLLVIGQTDVGETTPGMRPDFPEYVVINSARPVLIVPAAGHFEYVGQRVLVAWNASLEATRAVAGAIPLLRRAQQVDVAVFRSSAEAGAHGAQPGADIALYLARHDIQVEVLQEDTETDVGHALLLAASDWSYDLIVMGGYGHSRLHEILLGGATRTMLEAMTVPVLMSH